MNELKWLCSLCQSPWPEDGDGEMCVVCSSRTMHPAPPDQIIHQTMRQFDSGATRSPLGDKLMYARFFDARVIKRWAEYMHKHRKQADGTIREPDNYKKGITFDSYIDSKWRHDMDVWLYSQGYQSEMSESLLDSLCAIMFNAHGLIMTILAEEDKAND